MLSKATYVRNTTEITNMTARIRKALFRHARRFPTDSGLNFSRNVFHDHELRISMGSRL